MTNNKTQKLTELNEKQCHLVFGGYSFNLPDQDPLAKNRSNKEAEMAITPIRPKPDTSA